MKANARGNAPGLKQFLCVWLSVYAAASNAFVDMLANGESMNTGLSKTLVAAACAAVRLAGIDIVGIAYSDAEVVAMLG